MYLLDFYHFFGYQQVKTYFQYFININDVPDSQKQFLTERIKYYENRNKANNNDEKDSQKETINNLMSVIIRTRNDEHMESFICKSSDKFNTLENKFYKLHSEYKDKDNKFLIGKEVIDKEKTLEENKIGNNAKIIIEENE